jgi:xylan 1,4-beta-xylosidase
MGNLILPISADSTTYAFAVEDRGGNHQQVATGETRSLSTQVTGGFVGVYIGMYATGNGNRAAAPADFDWFEYTHS